MAMALACSAGRAALRPPRLRGETREARGAPATTLCGWRAGCCWRGEARAGRAAGALGWEPRARPKAVAALSAEGVEAEAEAKEGRKFDVSSSCVTPVFRSAPLSTQESEGPRVKVLFLSEGNVCRSVYAEAVFAALLAEKGLDEQFVCASRATRDYNVGEGPDERAVKVAEEFQVQLPPGRTAAMFKPAVDIVNYDIAAVVDKFVAADVLKEVSVFDTINPQANFSAKVRRLGDFCKTRQVEDIDDPLYGNMGSPEELENLRRAYVDIRESCEGLLEELLEVRTNLRDGESLKEGVFRWLRSLEALDWMVPPMLQKRNA